MKLDGSKWVHVVAVAIMSIFIFLFYMFLTNKFGSIKIVNIMFVFIFSGAMCSLIDKVFWDGSLDYILLNGFFTFDLKDLYIDIFIGLFVLLLIFKNKELREIDEKSMFKDFCNYILRKSNK
jgi:signal peptidase II